MPTLFSPLKIKSIELRNRLVVSPMCQYSSEDGFANLWHLIHLGTRAVGGAGLIFTEAAAVSEEGRITFADLGIWKNEHTQKLQEITQFILEQGAVPGIQLAHAGRKASCQEPWNGGKQIPSDKPGGWKTVGPSNFPFRPDQENPIPLSIIEIQIIQEDFRKAANRALESGFKVLEIHAAHGYLIHQFLSPLSNHRTDEYGGSFENRIRLLIEIVESINRVWPADLPLFVRISATEWVEEGWSVQDSIALSRILKSLGVDLVDCSSGGNIQHAKIPVGPGYQVAFAESIKKEATILTGAVGLITDAAQANAIIENEQADLVFLARQLLRDPYFPLKAAQALGVEIAWPKQYERAKLRE